MKLFLGNLPFSATEDDIRNYLADFGSVTDLYIPLDRESGRPRGFVFVTFATQEEADTAMENLNQSEMDGRQLKASPAIERERSGGGGGGGGYKGGGGGGYRDGGGGGGYRDGGGGGRGRSGGGGGHRDRGGRGRDRDGGGGDRW